ncbi:MAG: HAD family hydrolase [Terracidiphilus sp.]
MLRLRKAVVFDMDDTLFLEYQYVLSGFRHIAGLVAQDACRTPEEIFAFLTKLTKRTELRGRVLDALLEVYPRIGIAWSISRLIDEYRSHIPRISLFRGVAPMLSELRRAGAYLSVITDGASASQHRKAEALKLPKRMDLLIVTDDQGIEYRKPHPDAFRRISETVGCDPDACVYVGDNPVKDFIAPRKLGWKTIRIRLPRQLHANVEPIGLEYAPSTECRSIIEMRSALMTWLTETGNSNKARLLPA